MEAENRGVVETQMQVSDLAYMYGEPYYGIRFHVFKRGSGNGGKVVEIKVPFIDFIESPFNFVENIRTLAGKLEALQKEAETW